MNIKQNLLSKEKYELKCPYSMSPKWIVIHNTANDASAKDEINYMINNSSPVSYHYAVDDKEIIQGLPLDRNAFHCGDGIFGDGNRYGIGIEICYSKSGGTRFIQAEKNAARLVAKLLKQYGWGIEKVRRHYDFSPYKQECPHRSMMMGWQRFLDMVKDELNSTFKLEPFSGYLEVTYNGLAIHSVPSWDDTTICDFAEKGVYTVVGRILVEDVYMYKLKAGNYITSSPKYVKYRTTLHG